jgi:hypothetical protein
MSLLVFSCPLSVRDLSVCVQDHKQWRNIAFCLGQLSIGEKGFRKMADLFRCYKDSLADPDILAFFQVTPHHSSIAALITQLFWCLEIGTI